MTVTQTAAVPELVNVTESAVCPPAQFGSAHIAVVRMSTDGLPAVTACAKFPAAPPRVIPVTDGLVVAPVPVMQTIRQLPAVVEAPSVTDSGDAVPVALTDWTREGAIGYDNGPATALMVVMYT
jgi:hypothetical protein